MAKPKIDPASTQQYLNIDKVRDGIVVMRDGRLRMILKAMPINFDLKNEKEKEVTIYQFQNVLNALSFPVEIVVQSRRVDLSHYISLVQQQVGNITNDLLLKQAKDYIEFIKMLGEEINIMEKNFYIVITHAPKGIVEKETLIDKVLNRKNSDPTNFDDKSFGEYKDALGEKAKIVSSRFSSVGVSCTALDTKQIIELFYNTYNPEEASTEHLDDVANLTSSVVTKKTSDEPNAGVQAIQAEAAKTEVKQPEAVTAATTTVRKSSISEIMTKVGLGEHKLDPAEELFKKGLTSLLDIIAPAGFNIFPNYLQLGNFYIRTLFVFTYPRYLQANWLSPLINLDVAFDLAIYIYPEETAFLLGQLRRKTTQLQSSENIEREKGLVRNPELETAIGDIEELRDTLQKGETKLFQSGVYITLYSQTLEELNKLAKQVEAQLAGQLIYTKQAFFQMEQGFNSTLPLMDDEINVMRNLDTPSLSTCFPLTSSELSHHEGVLYGINLSNNSLVLFDRFKMENANQVVFAKSGAGKSYAVKLEATRQMMLGTEIIVVDPENEYKPLCEALGGTYVNLSLNSQQKINPFDLPFDESNTEETAEQILRSTITSIHGLVSLMVGGLSPEEDSLLDKALYETYALKDITYDPTTFKNEPPLMRDLVTVLQNMTGAESLVNRLAKYVDGSFANIFNAQTNIDINNHMTAFSIRDMEDELRPLAMYLVLNFIWGKVKSKRTKRMLIVDEAWVMMRFEDSAKFLSAMVKRARKYYLGLVVISQDVEDFLASSYGRSVVNNSSTQLLLGQSTTATDKITETFKLTDGEKFFLTEAEVGQGLFFAGTNHAAIQIVSSYTEDQIITTDPKQLKELYGI